MTKVAVFGFIFPDTCLPRRFVPSKPLAKSEAQESVGGTPETKNPEICPSESPPSGRGPGLVLGICDFMVRLAAPLHYSAHRLPADD
jgi:hypothetical protein